MSCRSFGGAVVVRECSVEFQQISMQFIVAQSSSTARPAEPETRSHL